MKKRFHLGDVLSITTGCLVSPSGMGGIYGILNHLTGDNLFTHQLPRAMRECQPWLLRWFPGLAAVQFPAEPRLAPEQVPGWLAEQVAAHGEWLDVDQISRDDHEVIDPVAELESMVGKDKVIVVKADG